MNGTEWTETKAALPTEYDVRVEALRLAVESHGSVWISDNSLFVARARVFEKYLVGEDSE